MSSAAQAAEDVPVIGDELAAPFGALGSAGASVGGAGQAAQDAVGTLAAVLAVVLVVLPVCWLLLRWLPWRLAWVRDAGVARQLAVADPDVLRSEEHTSELQSRQYLVCRLLLEKKKKQNKIHIQI